jgi:hypothetical protein
MLQITTIGQGINPAWIFAAGGGKPDDDGGKKEEEQSPGDDDPGYGEDSGEGGEGSD